MEDVSDGKTKGLERVWERQMVLTPSSLESLEITNRDHVTLYASASHLTFRRKVHAAVFSPAAAQAKGAHPPSVPAANSSSPISHYEIPPQ